MRRVETASPTSSRPAGPASRGEKPAPARARLSAPKQHTKRLFAVLAVIVIALAYVAWNVVKTEGISAAKYAAYGRSELFRTVSLPALRGTIYDRSGNVLAVSVPRVDVVADDFLVPRPIPGLRQLAAILHMPAGTLTAKLSERSGYVPLAVELPQSVGDRVSALNEAFISLVPDTLRIDPSGSLFSPLLGIVGWDNRGLSGLEYQYQQLLAGRAGSEQLAESIGGLALPTGARDMTAAKQGSGLILTLDQSLQYEATKALAAQIAATHAASGSVVVLDTRTGDVLSMVNLARDKAQVVPAGQNLALTAQYQPGSVMKLATFSGALQSGIINPTSVFTVPDQIMVGGWPFQDAELHPTQQMPVSQILAQSSNVGTIEIAHLLGAQRLYHFLRDLGFGQKTGLDWPGETAGTLAPPDQWYASDMGTIPIGTGEAVTAMQIVDAYNAVANGGVFVPPRLIEGTVAPSGAEHMLPTPAPHRVLDQSTARELVPMLELVTKVGTAPLAQVPGYTVAGKTGTAQIPSTTTLGYQAGAWMATFVGFAPAQDPRLTAIVVLNRPDSMYGGSASAPVFSTIMSYALRHYDVPPPQSAADATP